MSAQARWIRSIAASSRVHLCCRTGGHANSELGSQHPSQCCWILEVSPVAFFLVFRVTIWSTAFEVQEFLSLLVERATLNKDLDEHAQGQARGLYADLDRNVSTSSREVGVLDRGLANTFKNATSETSPARETVNGHESRLARRSALGQRLHRGYRLDSTSDNEELPPDYPNNEYGSARSPSGCLYTYTAFRHSQWPMIFLPRDPNEACPLAARGNDESKRGCRLPRLASRDIVRWARPRTTKADLCLRADPPGGKPKVLVDRSP